MQNLIIKYVFMQVFRRTNVKIQFHKIQKNVFLKYDWQKGKYAHIF